MWHQSVELFFSGPWFALAVALLTAVLGPKLTGNPWVLAIAALVFGWAAFRTPWVSQQHAFYRVLVPVWVAVTAVMVLLAANGIPPVAKTVTKESKAIDASEILKRKQEREKISELIQRGRIHLMNLNSIVQGRVPDARKHAGELVNPALRYHTEVVSFAELHFGHDEAMRISIPAPAKQYPERIMAGIVYKNGAATRGYDLRTTWDQINGDLEALDRFLLALPELRP